jgi:hypothetical protein
MGFKKEGLASQLQHVVLDILQLTKRMAGKQGWRLQLKNVYERFRAELEIL